MTYISEKYQLGALIPYLKNRFDDFVTEANVYSIPIDIVAINDGVVTSIELKSRDHNRGIAQAERNTAYSDYSYISVWEDQVSEHLEEKLEGSPVGLIAVDEEAMIIQEAKELEPNQHAKEVTMKVFKDDF